MESVSWIEEQWFERGRMEGQKERTRQLLRLGLLSPEKIAEAFDMSLEEVRALEAADSKPQEKP